MEVKQEVQAQEQEPKAWPKVAIIILNWNGLKDTIECLESLQKITYPNYEVIVVDNGSQGNDVEVLKEKYGDYIHIIENDKNYGFSEGNNIGIRYALGKGVDYVLLLNNDTIVDAEVLSELVEAAQGDEKIGMVQPKIYRYYEPGKIDYNEAGLLTPVTFYLGMARIRLLLGKGQFEKTRRIHYPSYCCVLIKRKVLEDVGLLDPHYFFGGYMDMDLSHRSLRSGFLHLVLANARIWHKGSSSIGRKAPVLWYLCTRNKVFFARKNFSCFQYAAFIICLFTLQTPKGLLHAAVVNKGLSLTPAIFRGIYDGFTINIK
jgi:GT2 family glycosyltransferase